MMNPSLDDLFLSFHPQPTNQTPAASVSQTRLPRAILYCSALVESPREGCRGCGKGGVREKMREGFSKMEVSVVSNLELCKIKDCEENSGRRAR
ncbi:hypothetical protein COLO4_36451 [Corchorus olitorius]|uniref:Uncharacterized protein n=1 Tax=Corchorus olitorius TaxID=93759 RepID=A0A1R3G8T3_9ROSI|nr:hypothetical protein COLO4_36451 [Corchorus olitorius]